MGETRAEHYALTLYLVSEKEHQLLKKEYLYLYIPAFEALKIQYLYDIQLALFKETKTKNTRWYYNTVKSFEKLPDTVDEKTHTNAALG